MRRSPPDDGVRVGEYQRDALRALEMPDDELFEFRLLAVDGGTDEVADDAAHGRALHPLGRCPAERTALEQR